MISHRLGVEHRAAQEAANYASGIWRRYVVGVQSIPSQTGSEPEIVFEVGFLDTATDHVTCWQSRRNFACCFELARRDGYGCDMNPEWA